MHVTTTGAQLKISQEFLTRQTWYRNEEGKGEQVVVAAKGFHFTMGLKKVCPRNPELNPVVTCITPHASHNHLANTKKKTHIMSCHIRHACHTSHSRKTPKVQNSSSKFKITRCRMGPYSCSPVLWPKWTVPQGPWYLIHVPFHLPFSFSLISAPRSIADFNAKAWHLMADKGPTVRSLQCFSSVSPPTRVLEPRLSASAYVRPVAT